MIKSSPPSLSSDLSSIGDDSSLNFDDEDNYKTITTTKGGRNEEDEDENYKSNTAKGRRNEEEEDDDDTRYEYRVSNFEGSKYGANMTYTTNIRDLETIIDEEEEEEEDCGDDDDVGGGNDDGGGVGGGNDDDRGNDDGVDCGNDDRDNDIKPGSYGNDSKSGCFGDNNSKNASNVCDNDADKDRITSVIMQKVDSKNKVFGIRSDEEDEDEDGNSSNIPQSVKERASKEKLTIF